MYLKAKSSPHTTRIFGLKYLFIAIFETNQMLKYHLIFVKNLYFSKLNGIEF